jgi:hypothetical protein
MSQQLQYKCDGCGSTSADNNWTRLLGAFAGQPALAQASPFPQQAVVGARPVTLDLCADCAAKTTVAQLVALTTALTPKPAVSVNRPVAAAK